MNRETLFFAAIAFTTDMSLGWASCPGPSTDTGYSGSIDNRYRITVVPGVGYAYNTSDHVIPLQREDYSDIPGTTVGNATGVTTATLTALDANGQVMETFTGEFKSEDPKGRFHSDKPLRCEVFVGVWTNQKDGQRLPFFLSESGTPMGGYDALVDRAAVAFRRAVVSNDRHTVVAAIRYPIYVAFDGKKKNVMRRIADASALLSIYDHVFLPEFVAKVKASVPLLMFHNSYGVMLGNGEIWFDASTGEVTSIANQF
jgi:hypothetical protein